MSIGALLLAVCLCVAVLFDKSDNPSLPYSDIEGFTTIIEATDKSGVEAPADIVNNGSTKNPG